MRSDRLLLTQSIDGNPFITLPTKVIEDELSLRMLFVKVKKTEQDIAMDVS